MSEIVNLSLLAGAGWQFFTNAGLPLSGGTLQFYLAGTTTPATTYTTSTGDIANPNPIFLLPSGRLSNEVWLIQGVSYKIVLSNSTGSVIGTYDNIVGSNDPSNILTQLSNTSNVVLGDALVGFKQSNQTGVLTNAVARTVHQKLQEWVSVKDFGATGDGTTDDTSFVQNCINTVRANGGGGIYFPPGVYKITSVYYYSNISFHGAGSSSQLFKPPTAEKFSRMFTVNDVEDFAQDSPLVSWSNLYFNGNVANQPSGDLEQAHLIFLAASNDNPGRLRAQVSNCIFESCIADAISIYTNVDIQVSNCFFRECRRGSVVVTGGNSYVQLVNIDARGVTNLSRIDAEIDGAGYLNNLSVNIQMSNVFCENGFDLGSETIIAQLDNVTTINGPITISNGGDGSRLKISNSYLVFGNADSFSNRLVSPGKIEFENCAIVFKRVTGSIGIQRFGIDVYYTNGSPSFLIFTNCDFYLDSSVQVTDESAAIYSLNNAYSLSNSVSVINCRIHDTFKIGVYNKGGTTLIQNTSIDAITPVVQDSSDSSGYNLTIDNMTVGGDADKWVNIVTSVVTTGIILHKNCTLDESVNVIASAFGFTTNVFRGYRLILGTSAPTTSTPGLKGDVYRLKTPSAGNPLEWVCTGYSGSDTVWKVSTTLAA